MAACVATPVARGLSSLTRCLGDRRREPGQPGDRRVAGAGRVSETREVAIHRDETSFILHWVFLAKGLVY